MNMLYSLKNANPDSHIHIWFLDCGNIELKLLNDLKNFCENASWEFTSIDVSNDERLKKLYDAFLQIKKRQNINIEYLQNKSTFSRVLIPYVLPEEIDRCLWLDADNIILNSIQELYDTPLKDTCIGVTIAGANLMPPKGSIYLFYKHKMHVSTMHSNNVILYNLLKCREIPFSSIEKLLDESGKYMSLLEQDLYNVLFHNKKTPLQDNANLLLFQWKHDTPVTSLNKEWPLGNPDDIETVDNNLKKYIIVHACMYLKLNNINFSYYNNMKKYLFYKYKEETNAL